MSRVKSHDDECEFARLMKRWEEPIRRLCTRMTGDPHRGEDLKQDTFLRLFEKRKQYEPSGRFTTFLWRIALNICYDEIRRQKRRREFFTSAEDQESHANPSEAQVDGPAPDMSVAQLEEGEIVRRALLELPDIYRTVLVLRHYHDLKLAKIAEILEIPEGTVNSRMAEALSRLSRILEPMFKPEPVRSLKSSGSQPGHFPRQSDSNQLSAITDHYLSSTNEDLFQYESSKT